MTSNLIPNNNLAKEGNIPLVAIFLDGERVHIQADM